MATVFKVFIEAIGHFWLGKNPGVRGKLRYLISSQVDILERESK